MFPDYNLRKTKVRRPIQRALILLEWTSVINGGIDCALINIATSIKSDAVCVIYQPFFLFL